MVLIIISDSIRKAIISNCGRQEKYNFEAEEIPEQEVYHETVSSTRIRQAISEGYIQRANAYLDHYYIVMGKPENTDRVIGSELPHLLNVPITEECKILPSPGIYAVSVESGSDYSKGMVIINRENGERAKVLINIFDDNNHLQNSKVSILFHKKIHGAVNLSDTRSAPKIASAKVEISDLIY
ncbi:MAG: hypothetical protein IPH69_13300 [Bacteroidales bacterium]|nr:hypothetical protein [Bacteroidales bacterium]